MNDFTKSLKLQKAEVRQRIKEIFKNQVEYSLKVKERFSDEDYCSEFLMNIPNIEKFKTAFGYAELKNEFPCYNLLKAFRKRKMGFYDTKFVALPVVKGESLIFRQIDFNQNAKLKTGSFKILEPDESCPILFSGLNLNSIEMTEQLNLLEKLSPILVFTPARAFSFDGSRLGRGGGYYDKFFAQMLEFQSKSKHIQFTAVGLAFSFQILDCIPNESTDFKVHQILTEK